MNNEFVQVDNSVTNDSAQMKNSTDPTSSFKDKSVQVEFERYRDFVRNEKDLSSMTGLCSFSLLDFLEDIVKIVFLESS